MSFKYWCSSLPTVKTLRCSLKTVTYLYCVQDPQIENIKKQQKKYQNRMLFRYKIEQNLSDQRNFSYSNFFWMTFQYFSPRKYGLSQQKNFALLLWYKTSVFICISNFITKQKYIINMLTNSNNFFKFNPNPCISLVFQY